MLRVLLVVTLLGAPKTWKVTGTDVTFTQLPDDLEATQAQETKVSLAAHRREFDRDVAQQVAEAKEAQTDLRGYNMEESYAVLSIVGTLVSIEESGSGFMGGAHPYGSSTYHVIDAARPTRKVSLLDLFPEKEVVAALRGDPFIKQHVADGHEDDFKQDTSVTDLLQDLDGSDDCVSFDPSALSAFAFHHMEGDRVAVRLSFPYSAEICRGDRFIVGLLLRVPPKLRATFDRASSCEEGFLTKDAKAAGAPVLSLKWSREK